MKVSEKRQVAQTGVEVTVIGMGCVSLGGLYAPVSAADAIATLQAAWDAGIRYFDVAPLYGVTRSEHLLGQFIRDGIPEAVPRPIISTKVGRLYANLRPGRELPPEPPRVPVDGFRNALPFREGFDYSYDGIMRSFDDSQQRMGTRRLDLLFVHDIGVMSHGKGNGEHWRALTSGGGFKALTELRSAGLIAGFGLGVNEWEVIDAAMKETYLDCCLLAGRYTLLEQTAAAFLDRARAAGTAIVIGGVFNSGILAAANGGNLKFNYQDATPEIAERTGKLAAICAAFDVPLGAAAIQFPLLNPAVTSVLIGAKHPSHVRQNVEWFESEVPGQLWSSLRDEGHIA